MSGLCEGGNEPAGSLKVIWKINLVLKMKTKKKAPKPMQLVISAIKNLRQPKGSTPKKIAKYIMSLHPSDAGKLKRRMNKALKRGVAYGILRTDRGRYQLEDLADGSMHMRSHRRRRSRSGRRERRGGRRRSSSRRRRHHSGSGSRRGGHRRRSSDTRHRRRSRPRRDLPVRTRKNVSEYKWVPAAELSQPEKELCLCVQLVPTFSVGFGKS
ncbi:hypothetical protein ANN_05793 [Periplaneta americana]|uniref:H15 domain-containing protein n=1 Tax=Periplaneta americana TaxID=6978 RepID=A0ABQ8TDK9_PERAM|nr:hypothetical protein ANN_05793 [Periplaneta americana]